MFKRLFAALALLTLTACTHAEFDKDFTGRALRVDYYHSGTTAEEHLALERVRDEGAWPGSHKHLIDTTNLGKYLVEVIDGETNRVIYSRGFCSVYGEWETTAPALDGVWNTIPESVRVPEPRREFVLRLSKRDEQQEFQELWTVSIDPTSQRIFRAPPPKHEVWDLVKSGPARKKVDVVLLGDGYAASDKEQFRKDVAKAVDALFAYKPFTSRKRDFNVRAVWTPAEQSGVTKPDEDVFRNSPLGTTYCAFDTTRYVLSFDDRAWRNAAAAAPYEFVIILLNEERYGGGGIQNCYAITAARAEIASAVLVHEFAHHFGGVADEYFGAPVAYEDTGGPQVEPWEPNVTALLDPTRVKWQDLIAADTPIPTPWDQDAYSKAYQVYAAGLQDLRKDGASAAKMAAYRARWKERFSGEFAANPYVDRVGAFEGAMYQAQGLYRPCLNCVMHMADSPEFCPVCARAIERIIELNTE